MPVPGRPNYGKIMKYSGAWAVVDAKNDVPHRTSLERKIQAARDAWMGYKTKHKPERLTVAELAKFQEFKNMFR